MNDITLQMKGMQRAMRSYILSLYEFVFEGCPEFVLEIGTGQCQSSRTILSALNENKKGRLISVDVGNRTGRIPETLLPYFTQITGDSHLDETLNKVKEISPVYDFLFIDGDHTYAGVKKDFEMYVPLVKERGLILMHDITNKDAGVKDFWKEIKYPKISLEYGRAANDIIPGMGIVQVIDKIK